jgi:hypothetical protein
LVRAWKTARSGDCYDRQTKDPSNAFPSAALSRLADLESLALKHEIRREAIFRKLERRRKKRYAA